MIYGVLLAGVMTLAFAFSSYGWLALVIVTLHGLPFQVHEIAKRTVLQQSAEPALLPKVFSVQGTLMTVTFGLAVVVMAFVTDVWGVRVTYYLSAALCGLSGLLAIWKLHLAKNVSPPIE